MDFRVTRRFPVNKLTFKTFYQYKNRKYDSVWMAYGKIRTFDQDYFGIEFLQRDDLGQSKALYIIFSKGQESKQQQLTNQT